MVYCRYIYKSLTSYTYECYIIKYKKMDPPSKDKLISLISQKDRTIKLNIETVVYIVYSKYRNYGLYCLQ